MIGFNKINGSLCADKVPLTDIAKDYGTPAYVYSASLIKDNYSQYSSCIRKEDKLCFSVKSNSNTHILEILSKIGSGFDVVSGGELKRSLIAGGDPKNIVFSGVGKSYQDIELALENKKEVSIQGILGKIEDKKLLKPNKKVPIDFIKNLDDLPLPAYDLVDVDRYMKLQSHGFSPRPYEWGKRSFSLLTSRGCPHQCVFCSIQATMGYKWRHHSPENIKKHIDLIIEKYGCDFLHFEDDNFTHNPERYDEILDILINIL